MNITEITLKERQALLVGASDYEKLPDYEVNQSLVRFCESRGISPVIAYAFLNIDYDADDERCVNNVVDVRYCIDNPRQSDFLKIRKVLIELRLQQKIIITSDLAKYIKYVEQLKMKELSRLFSEI